MPEETKVSASDPLVTIEDEASLALSDGEKLLADGSAFVRELVAIEANLQTKGLSIKMLLEHVAKTALGVTIDL